MDIVATINLDSVLVGGEWDTTLGDMVRNELKDAIRAELRRVVKEDPQLKKAITALHRRATEQIMEALEKTK